MRSNQSPTPLLEAVEQLQQLNATHPNLAKAFVTSVRK